MEDSNSSQPSKCPCGFWGSASTQGLCSRCYKEHVQKSKEAMQTSPSGKPGLSSKDKPDSSLRVTPKVPATASTSKGDNCHKSSSPVCDSSFEGAACSPSRLHSVLSPVLSQTSNKLSSNSKTDINKDSASSERVIVDLELSASEVNTDSASTSSALSSLPNTQNTLSSSTDSPSSSTDTEQRGTKRQIADVQLAPDTPEKSPQKSRKRCNECNCKLELAQRTIGQCRCGCIFCPLHRLPELHNCDFDHKEDGRREAREKMLKPTRHMGRSCKRIDSDS